MPDTGPPTQRTLPRSREGSGRWVPAHSIRIPGLRSLQPATGPLAGRCQHFPSRVHHSGGCAPPTLPEHLLGGSCVPRDWGASPAGPARHAPPSASAPAPTPPSTGQAPGISLAINGFLSAGADLPDRRRRPASPSACLQVEHPSCFLPLLTPTLLTRPRSPSRYYGLSTSHLTVTHQGMPLLLESTTDERYLI